MNIKKQLNNFNIKMNTNFSNEKYYNLFLMSFILIISIYIISCDKIILNDNSNLKNANYIEKIYNFQDKFENLIINGNFEIEIVKCDSQYVVVDNIIEHSVSQIRPEINLKNGNLIIDVHNNIIENSKINSHKFDDCSKNNNSSFDNFTITNDNLFNNQNNHNNQSSQSSQSNQKLKLTIYTNKINKLTIKGNSKIYSNDTLNFDNIICQIEGNSFIDFYINSKKIDFYSNGNSCVIFKGKVQDLNMDIVGNENINFDELQIINSEIKVAGNSNVVLKVEDKLKAEILGNAKIILLNNPKIVESDITGNGFIRK